MRRRQHRGRRRVQRAVPRRAPTAPEADRGPGRDHRALRAQVPGAGAPRPAIREAALATSKIDRYAGPDGRYRIRSLYFDTLRFDLYAANEREQPDCFKMRARCYPASKTSPVFLEVKRRVLDVIATRRGWASPAGLWGGGSTCSRAGPPRSTRCRRRSGRATKFLAPYHRHHLVPAMLVEYEREAYERRSLLRPPHVRSRHPRPVEARAGFGN